MIDFSKAFNRINHAKVIIRLSDWGVPSWLVGRSMVVNHKVKQSKAYLLPGSVAQGDELGQLLFLVAMSDVALPPAPPLPEPVHPGDISSCVLPLPPPLTPEELRLKWIDDVTIAETIKLDKCLKLNSEFIGPRNFHQQNNMYLPGENSRIQTKLKQIENYVEIHQMQLNRTKTKIQPFNFSKKYDFLPEIKVEGQNLEVVYTTKILGVTFSSSMKWDQHIDDLVARARQKVWFIQRLKKIGASRENLVEMYKLFVRQALEFAAPLWSSNLTQQNKNKIERIQAQVSDLILGPNQLSYIERLRELNLCELESRRQKLSKTFCMKMIKDDRYKFLFPQRQTSTRSKKKFIEPQCKTNRLKFSAIPSFIRMLNGEC